MPTKTFTKEEVFDLVEEDDTIHLSSISYKHDFSEETYVVKYEGSYWKFTFLRSYDNGWMIENNGVEAVEVVPKEKVVIEWVEK